MNLYSSQNDDLISPPPVGSETDDASGPSFSRLDMTGLISHSSVPADTPLQLLESYTSLDDSAGSTPLITKRKGNRVAPPPKPKVDADSMTESQRSEIEWTYGSAYSSNSNNNNKKKKRKKSSRKSSSKKKKEDEDSTENITDEDDSEHDSNGTENKESADKNMANKRQISTNVMTVNSSIVIKYDNDDTSNEKQEDDERLEVLKEELELEPQKEDSDYFEIECGRSDRVSTLGLDVRMSMLINTRESAYSINPFNQPQRYNPIGNGTMVAFGMDEIKEDDEVTLQKTRSIPKIQPKSRPKTQPKLTTKANKQPKSIRKSMILLAIVFCVCAIVAFVLWLLNDQGILSWGKENKITAGATEGGSSQAPTVDISAFVKDAILAEFGPTTFQSLEDASFPQTKAAKWIDEVDTMFTFPMSSSESRAFRQRYAMATFFYATLGPDFWYDDINFLSELHECDWNQGSVGVTCNKDLEVSEINLVLNGLRGSIPPELGELEALKAIVLDGNRISGSLPDELYQLTNLVTLSIPYSKLTGSLGAMIGNLGKLETLWIEGASLDGTMPSELRKLTNLDRLVLGDNSLSGTIPRDVANLPRLQELNLSFNNLTGQVPSGSYGALREFAVDGNQLTGSFPTSVFGNQLRVLTLHDNRFTGTLPNNAWSSAGSITTLDISDNNFRGTIPNSLGSLFQLETLIAQNAGLSGTLPDDLGSTSLEVLDLEGNSLIGTVPTSYASLPLGKFRKQSFLTCWWHF
jgi:hypothetical protein